MGSRDPAIKKSVTIDPDLLNRLGPERLRNLSATVNESLRLLAALDAQQALVEEWEAEHGQFSEEDLRPFLEAAMQAQIENTLRVLEEHKASNPARSRGAKSTGPGSLKGAGLYLGTSSLPGHPPYYLAIEHTSRTVWRGESVSEAQAFADQRGAAINSRSPGLSSLAM
jgi:hypothetical protein